MDLLMIGIIVAGFLGSTMLIAFCAELGDAK